MKHSAVIKSYSFFPDCYIEFWRIMCENIMHNDVIGEGLVAKSCVSVCLCERWGGEGATPPTAMKKKSEPKPPKHLHTHINAHNVHTYQNSVAECSVCVQIGANRGQVFRCGSSVHAVQSAR